MKSALMILAIAAMALPFSACESKTIVEGGGADRDHRSSVREDTTVRHERDSGGGTYERHEERVRD